jgi:hypothetical protein
VRRGRRPESTVATTMSAGSSMSMPTTVVEAIDISMFATCSWLILLRRGRTPARAPRSGGFLSVVLDGWLIRDWPERCAIRYWSDCLNSYTMPRYETARHYPILGLAGYRVDMTLIS